jgi:dihydrofolate reductase
MTQTDAHFSISLDGFMAGPDQDRDSPLGVRGLELHRWHFADDMTAADTAQVEDLLRPRGAFVMGRNMYGPIRGEWDEDWRGWWGEDPPYHAPVFVLTHHPHDPIAMDGGTTFHFVTDGFDAAYALARDAAGERDVSIAGGASTIRQALTAGVIDELVLDIAPVVLGSGESPFHGVDDLRLEPIEVSHSPHATHVRYRVGG